MSCRYGKADGARRVSAGRRRAGRADARTCRLQCRCSPPHNHGPAFPSAACAGQMGQPRECAARSRRRARLPAGTRRREHATSRQIQPRAVCAAAFPFAAASGLIPTDQRPRNTGGHVPFRPPRGCPRLTVQSPIPASPAPAQCPAAGTLPACADAACRTAWGQPEPAAENASAAQVPEQLFRQERQAQTKRFPQIASSQSAYSTKGRAGVSGAGTRGQLGVA